MKLDINQTAEFFSGVLCGIVGLLFFKEVIFFNKSIPLATKLKTSQSENVQIELEKEIENVSSVVELAQQKIREQEREKERLKGLAYKNVKDIFDSGFEKELSKQILDLQPTLYSENKLKLQEFQLYRWMILEIEMDNEKLLKNDIYEHHVEKVFYQLLKRKMTSLGWKRFARDYSPVIWVLEKK